MPLEYVQPDNLLPMAERRQAGHDLRRLVPRRLHATWKPPADRRDPLDTLIETSRHRISSLLPIRYGRMQPSAFAFLRGCAAIMAADLASTPTSGIWVQSCGDCHLANFGVYAASDGTPIFDVIDFDETLPAPFEWDLKRLASQRCGRCTRPSDVGACLPRSRRLCGHGISPTYGETHASRSA